MLIHCCSLFNMDVNKSQNIRTPLIKTCGRTKTHELKPIYVSTKHPVRDDSYTFVNSVAGEKQNCRANLLVLRIPHPS